MSVVDDFGRFSANPKLLRASCFPLRLDTVSDGDVNASLLECVVANLIKVYEVTGKQYLELVDFRQQVRSKVSKFPDPVGNGIIPLAVAKQLPASAHLVGDVGEDGDVVEDVGGVGAREPARAVQIAVLLRSSGIDGANASNPLLMEWAENAKVTDDLLQTAVGMVKARNPVRPGPKYIAPIIAQLLNPPPVLAKPKFDDWYRSDAGISRKASELGIYARPGDSFAQLRERCESELRKREGVAA
jgi:hypothetical protein